MRALLISMLWLAAVLCSGCGSERKLISTGELIQETGLYELKGTELRLQVFKDEEGRIDYMVYGPGGRVLVQAEKKFTPLHRWSMAFDESMRLWVHSSDVGTVVWTPEADGYSEKSLEQTNASEMPRKMWESLPRTLQSRWREERAQSED